jgi:hypothetical protein
MASARERTRHAALEKLPRPRSFRKERLAAALLAAAAVVAYHNSFRGPFVMDDRPAIPWNSTIRALWPLSDVLSPPPRSPVTGRPLVNLSLALNYAFGKLDPVSYHAFNLAIHILCALVLLAIVRRTFSTTALRPRYHDAALGIATATALLWVVHPLTTESVDYTTQRTELLMGLFFLLTLYCSLRGFESPKSRAWHAAALLSFALGLASKEVIVVVPAIVLGYDSFFGSGSVRRALERHWRLYAGFAVVLALFVLLVGTRLRRTFVGMRGSVTPWDYAKTQCGVIIHYLRLALWPHPLSADYGDWPVETSVASVLPSLIVVGALLALTALGLVRRRKLAVLGLWFFAILAPTSSFRPITAEVAAERRMYLPLAAVVLLAVLAGKELLRRLEASRAVTMIAVGAIAITLAFVTVRRNDDYRTTFAFWSDMVSKRPENPRARMGLGEYFFKQGRGADALEQLAAAVRSHPENVEAHHSLGFVLASQGRTDEAIEHYREALRIDPRHARTHYKLALALIQRGQREEATEHLNAALRVEPRFSLARRALEDLRRSLNP